SRSSGPGGQHANVTASRVEASFDVLASRSLSESQRSLLLARAGARVAAVAQDERSQARNRQLALARLGERLERAPTPPKPRRPDAGAQAMIRYTPSASEAIRRRREADSAASGRTHTTYHGSAQLSVATSATLAQPHAAMASPRRHAYTQHASSAAPSAAPKR